MENEHNRTCQVLMGEWAARMWSSGKKSQGRERAYPGKNIPERGNSLCKSFRKSLGNTKLVQPNSGVQRREWSGIVAWTSLVGVRR